MIYYLLLFIGAVMIVLSVDIDKYYQKSVEGLNNIECAIRKTIPGSLVCALLFYAMNGFKLNVSAISVGLGAALAALNLLSTLACFKAYDVPYAGRNVASVYIRYRFCGQQTHSVSDRGDSDNGFRAYTALSFCEKRRK